MIIMHSTQKEESRSIPLSLGPRCNGVILYEDPATERRALALWNQIQDDMGPEVKCDVALWSTDLFEIPSQREGAFCETAQTDVVTLSMHDTACLSRNASKWLTQWLNTKSSLPRALIVLHDTEEENEVVAFLRTMAEFVGVSMFSRGNGEEKARNGLGATSAECNAWCKSRIL